MENDATSNIARKHRESVMLYIDVDAVDVGGNCSI